MVRTRAQDKADAPGGETRAPTPTKRKQDTPKKGRKHEREEVEKSGEEAHARAVKGENRPEEELEEPPKKIAKQEEGKKKNYIAAKDKTSESTHLKNTEVTSAAKNETSKVKDPKTQALISKYGTFPLADTSLPDPESATATTLLAHLLNAMLSSTRIAHGLAQKTLHCVMEAGYADLEKLEKSTWEERTEVLTKGGYTHYREKTATQMGELVELVRSKYDGDLNNLLEEAKAVKSGQVQQEVRKKVKAVKGLGEVAVDVFCDTVQGLWTEVAPFVDPRSLKTAEVIGLSSNVDELFESVGRNSKEMARLVVALTTVRLDGKEGEFK